MMKNKKLYIIFSILIAIFAICVVDKQLQNDTFFTIPIGNNILENGITTEEQLTWHKGLEFTNSRWAFDIIIATIYNIANFNGIYIFVLLMTIIIGLTLFNVLLKRKNNILISFFTTITALYFCRMGFSARGQIVSYLMFIIEVFFIEMLIETNKKRYSIGLILVSIIVTNFHSSVWPMYFVLYMPYFAEYICSKMKLKNITEKIVVEKFEIKLLLITFCLSIFTGLCTPIGLAPYTDMVKVMSGVSNEFISELQPVYILENIGIFASCIIYIMLISFNNIKIKVSDACLVCGLIFMALMAKRNIAFLFLIASISCARMVTNIINEEIVERLTNQIENKNSYISILSVLIITFAISNYTTNLGQEYVSETLYPVAATEYILENVDIEKMHIFNHFNFGSYLEFKGIPVFLDSRSGIFCKEFNETTILEDWLKCAHYGEMSYKDLFEKYGITHALLYKGEIVNTYISEDENYKKLYEDESFAFYEKIK